MPPFADASGPLQEARSYKGTDLRAAALALAVILFFEEKAPDSLTSAIATKASLCVAQYVSHPLLDAVYSGFREELEKSGFNEDLIDFSNANGDATTAQILADQLCSRKCDWIFVLATPMAQGVKAACPGTKPIIFGAITDPITAQLVESMEMPGTNLTGTSDQWPYTLQMELIGELWGHNARVGIPFNPAEANTQYAMEQTRAAALGIGLNLKEVPVNSVLEATQAVDSLAGKVDVIYIPADNTVVSAAPAVIAAADRQGIPVVAGDPGTFAAGATVGLGVNYKNLGVINARQLLEIRKGGKPAEMPVQVSDEPELYINTDKAQLFSLDTEAIRDKFKGE